MNSGETMSLPDFDAIAGRQTVAEFVNEYGRAEKDIRTGFALVKRGLEALGEGTTGESASYARSTPR